MDGRDVSALGDEELQELFAAGALGVQGEDKHRFPRRQPAKMVEAEVDAATKEFAISDKLGWAETFMLSSEVEHGDANDDFGRENAFYDHTLDIVATVVQKLREAKIPIQRPSDYYAEMLKTDDHMRRIREKLLTETQKIEASETARKQRQNKKFGKEIQQQIVQKRLKDKTDAISNATKLRKGLKQKLSNAEDMFEIEADDDGDSAGRRGKGSGKGGGKSRAARNAKFGHGGKNNNSRVAKRNDSTSYLSGKGGFSVQKNKQQFKNGPGKGKGKAAAGKAAPGKAGKSGQGKPKRLGKSRRKQAGN